jgi:hypothetical protein
MQIFPKKEVHAISVSARSSSQNQGSRRWAKRDKRQGLVRDESHMAGNGRFF